MTIALTTAGSGLFVKLGGMGGILNDINSLRGGTATTNVIAAANMLTRFATLETQYNTAVKIQSTLDGDYSLLSGWQQAQQSLLSYLRDLAGKTLRRMAMDDANISQDDIPTAMAELIRQMSGVATVQASTVAAGAQTSFGSPVGDTVIVMSLKNGAGVTQEYVLAETLRFTCRQDAQNGGTAWQEGLTITGPTPVTDPLSYLWPGGSGAGGGLTLTDSDQNQVGTVLQNGGFTTFTAANNPDNWPIAVGVAGTGVQKELTAVLRAGGASLKFLGDGAELTCVRQPFNAVVSTVAGLGGTTYKLLPDTVYHLNFWVKMSSASPSTGILKVTLVDGSNATINDDASTANSVTATLTGIGDTNWHNYNAAFRTPANMSITTAGNYKLQIKLTTALESGKSVYIDNLSFLPATQIYRGGPYVTAHSGGTQQLLLDAWTIALTNTLGAFQGLFQKFFDMRALGMQLASAGSPSVSDSLLA